MILIDCRSAYTRPYGQNFYDFFVNHFGKDNVILGLESLFRPGDDPATVIETIMPQVDMLMLVVDPAWLTDQWHLNESDLTSLAVNAAFQNRTPAIKVLIDNAELPTASEVTTLQRALMIPSLRVDGSTFLEKSQRIVNAIKSSKQASAPPSSGFGVPIPPSAGSSYPVMAAPPQWPTTYGPPPAQPPVPYGAPQGQFAAPYQPPSPVYAPIPYQGGYQAPYIPPRKSRSPLSALIVLVLLGALGYGGYTILANAVEEANEDIANGFSSSSFSSSPTRRPQPTATPAPRFVDSVYVSSGGSVVYSDFYTSSSKQYLIVVSGTFQYDTGSYGGQLADARYRISDSGYGELHSMFEVNGSSRTPTVEDSYSSEYGYVMWGNGSAFYFQISDTWTLDNSGGLSVSIYEMP